MSRSEAPSIVRNQPLFSAPRATDDAPLKSELRCRTSKSSFLLSLQLPWHVYIVHHDFRLRKLRRPAKNRFREKWLEMEK